MICESCHANHGPLYACASYSPERKAEIQDAASRMRATYLDPEWIRKQIEGGVNPEAIANFRAMIDDWGIATA